MKEEDGLNENEKGNKNYTKLIIIIICSFIGIAGIITLTILLIKKYKKLKIDIKKEEDKNRKKYINENDIKNEKRIIYKEIEKKK